jgi:hypothetical protein
MALPYLLICLLSGIGFCLWVSGADLADDRFDILDTDEVDELETVA